MLFWCSPLFRVSLLSLLPMFISACQEKDLFSKQPVTPRKNVCCNRGICMPDMGHVVYIVDRCSDKEAFFHLWNLRPRLLLRLWNFFSPSGAFCSGPAPSPDPCPCSART